MGDSDDEWNGSSANPTNNSGNSQSNLYNNNNSHNFNATNGSNVKRNRDKFYRERDDFNNSNFSNNNRGNDRRDWNDRNRGNDSWKNRGNSNSGMNQSSAYPGSNYGGSNQMGLGAPGGYQRMSGTSNVSGGNTGSDYPRKYTHQSSPLNNYENNSPPYKKNKKDWDMNLSDRSNSMHGSGGIDQGYTGSNSYHGSAYGSMNPSIQSGLNNNYQNSEFNKTQFDSEYPTQPPFLSFKLFLQQQPDDILDEDAIKKYNEYKSDFKKTQINNFFLEHKEEEWFKSKYHPDESYKRRNEQNNFILNRVEVFMDLMSNGWLDNVSVEFDKSKELIKFLDAVVIKLEGGTDQDLKSFDSNSGSNEEDEVKEIKRENKTSENNGDKKDEGELPASTGIENQTNDSVDTTSNKRKQEDSGSESGAYSESDDDTKQKDVKKNKTNNNKKKVKSLPKNLSRTASIFMRNLAPSVTKQDLENLFKTYDGFKRVALSDPAPERGFFRRGWITFEPDVNVKDICWSLQNIKIKDCNPGAIVNRELTNRVRAISNLLSHHKNVVKNDLKIAMKIVQNMDKRWNLWQDESNSEIKPQSPKQAVENQEENNENSNIEEETLSKPVNVGPTFLPHKFTGTNPLLKNITDYLVEEMNAEEEELLRGDNASEQKTSTTNNIGSSNLDIDKNFNKVLDRLILYLRVVHSIDFYNSIEYQQEDLMPNRCGIIFVRPALPVNAASASLKVNQEEINQYIHQFEAKMKVYTEFKEKIELDIAKKLGLKDCREEIEKFIKTNTQELAPDRWLCPLSGKKFKGPEFIRKHLFYKHIDKINEVKKEVEYLNSYILDPKRPQLPEHPSNKGHSANSNQSGMSAPSNLSQQSYSNQISNMLTPPLISQIPFGVIPNRSLNTNWQGSMMPDLLHQSNNFASNFGSQYGMSHMNKKNYGFQYRKGKDSREVIQYKDLDAPDE